jgi:hypothetical protein
LFVLRAAAYHSQICCRLRIENRAGAVSAVFCSGKGIS